MSIRFRSPLAEQTVVITLQRTRSRSIIDASVVMRLLIVLLISWIASSNLHCTTSNSTWWNTSPFIC